MRTEPRFTRDLEIAVAVEDDEQAEQLLHELRARGYKLIAGVEQDRTERQGLVVPVSRSGQLLATKLLSESADRPQDRADAVALVRAASEADLDVIPAPLLHVSPADLRQELEHRHGGG